MYPRKPIDTYTFLCYLTINNPIQVLKRTRQVSKHYKQHEQRQNYIDVTYYTLLLQPHISVKEKESSDKLSTKR